MKVTDKVASVPYLCLLRYYPPAVRLRPFVPSAWLLLGGRGRWRTLALLGLGTGVVSGCTPWRIKCRRSAVLRSFHLFFTGEYHQPSCAASVGVRRSHWLQQRSSPGMCVCVCVRCAHRAAGGMHRAAGRTSCSRHDRLWDRRPSPRGPRAPGQGQG